MSKRTCSVDGCERPYKSAGYCNMHALRVRTHGEPGPAGPIKTPAYGQTACKHLDGCPRRARVHGWCSMHWKRIDANGEPGPALPQWTPRTGPCRHPDGCPKPVQAKGYCSTHYVRMRVKGELGPVRSQRDPEGRPQKNAAGYILIYAPGNPMAQPSTGYVMEHKVVMAEKLGRPLRGFENVHHINGIKDDNRPENLELWAVSQPSGQRPSDLAEWVVEHYPELVEAALAHRSQLRLSA